MRDIIRAVTDVMPLPDIAQRDEASRHWGSAEAHAQYQGSWPCLNSVEVDDAPQTAAAPEALCVAAWNIERCKHVEASAAVIGRAQADVVLATEMDLGMARSGQRHTTRELATACGFAYAFGVEFVELGLGDVHETATHQGESNRHGLHGNAILSRWPLSDVALIPLDDGGYWYVQAPKNDGQYRIGGRNAIAARIDTASGPLVLVAVHLESESDAIGRSAQIERLLDALQSLYGDAPAIIGGDLNTRDFLQAGLTGVAQLADPASTEPLFAAMQRRGFTWQGCNTGEVTTRLPPWAAPGTALKTLDWLFARGVSVHDPVVVPAVSTDGDYLSDHELIAVNVTP